MEVRPGRPGDHRHVTVTTIRQSRGTRGGGLQNASPVSFERAAQVPATTFDPETDDVEDLPALDVAEIERGANLAGPFLAGGAYVIRCGEKILACGAAGQAIPISREQTRRGAGVLLTQAVGLRVQGGSLIRAAFRHQGLISLQPENPLQLSRPSVLDPLDLVTGQGRRRTSVGLPAAQVHVCDGLGDTADRRLEPGHVHALGSGQLARQGRARGFLDAGLDRPRIQRGEPIGEGRGNSQDQAGKMARLRPKRVLSEKSGDTGGVLSCFGVAGAERLEHNVPGRVDPAAGKLAEAVLSELECPEAAGRNAVHLCLRRPLQGAR